MCWFTVVVYRRGLMETWERGIELIMDVSKAAGLPESEFEVNPPFLNLIIRFKESLGGLNGTFNNALRILPPCYSKTSFRAALVKARHSILLCERNFNSSILTFTF